MELLVEIYRSSANKYAIMDRDFISFCGQYLTTYQIHMQQVKGNLTAYNILQEMVACGVK